MANSAPLSGQPSAFDAYSIAKSENFPVAFSLFPRELREKTKIFYRFARTADDIADHPTMPASERNAQLNSMYDGLKNGNISTLPEVAKDYYALTQQGHTSLKYGLGLLNAFIQDTEKSRYATWSELIDYCHRSAATVGRTMLELAGENDADLEASDAICNVLQILNHMQDMKSDFLERDRIYVPEDFKIMENDYAAEEAGPQLKSAVKKMTEMIDEMLKLGDNLPKTLRSYRFRIYICTVLNVAKKLNQKLAHEDPIRKRVKLSGVEKLGCLSKGILQAI